MSPAAKKEGMVCIYSKTAVTLGYCLGGVSTETFKSMIENPVLIQARKPYVIPIQERHKGFNKGDQI